MKQPSKSEFSDEYQNRIEQAIVLCDRVDCKINKICAYYIQMSIEAAPRCIGKAHLPIITDPCRVKVT